MPALTKNHLKIHLQESTSHLVNPFFLLENDDISPASNATDGNPSTLWEQNIVNRPDSSKAITSLTIDLENEYSIDEIMISFQYGNRSRYKIEYSSDWQFMGYIC